MIGPSGGEVADEGLRRDEAAGKGDVQLAGNGLAHQGKLRLLRFALAQRAGGVHEHRRDAVEEGTVEISAKREMDPAELLDRGLGSADAVVGYRLAGKADAVVHGLEKLGAGLAVLDGEAREVGRRPTRFPVHAQEHHAVAAVDGQRERRRSILSGNTEVRIHTRLPVGTCESLALFHDSKEMPRHSQAGYEV